MAPPAVRFPWYGSATDLATDIAYVLPRSEVRKLIAELERYFEKEPEKFVIENLEIKAKEKKQ